MVDIEKCGAADVANILGFSVRRLQQLTKEIPLSQVAHGKYDLPQTVQAYANWLKEKSSEKGAGSSLKDETLKLTRAKRQKAEIIVQTMLGELHRAEDVMAIVGDMVATVRARILDLPSKLAPKMIAQDDIHVARETIQAEIRTVLQSLSEYNPEDYARRNKDYTIAGGQDEEDTG